MPTEPAPITFAEIVRRACEIVDPDNNDAVIGEFEQAFEDDDEPARAAGDVSAPVADVLARLDPAVNNGALAMAGALTIYLSYRRDELTGEPARLLALAAEAEWKGDPPEPVAEFLADRGIRT